MESMAAVVPTIGLQPPPQQAKHSHMASRVLKRFSTSSRSALELQHNNMHLYIFLSLYPSLTPSLT